MISRKGGRVKNKNLAPFPGTVPFVGYQAGGTLGRKLLHRANTARRGYVHIDNQRIPVRAAIHQLSGYSAHADQPGLLDWVRAMGERPADVRLVHGEVWGKRGLREAMFSVGR